MKKTTEETAVISSTFIRSYSSDGGPDFVLFVTDNKNLDLMFEGKVTADSIKSILLIANAGLWNCLPGRKIRIAIDDEGKVFAIGHLKKNLWLGPGGEGLWRDVSVQRQTDTPSDPKLYILKVTKDQYDTLSGSKTPMLCPHLEDFSDVTGHPISWLETFLDGMNVNWGLLSMTSEVFSWVLKSASQITWDTLIFIESSQDESGEIVQVGRCER